MTDIDDLQTRIEKLEMRVTHQDQTIEDLNATITDQWKQLEVFKRDIGRLTDEMRELENDGGSGQREPPPPHY